MSASTPSQEPPAAAVLAFPNAQAENMAAVQGQLRNIQTALAERYGHQAARLMLAEAAVRVIADTARETGSLVATRFALEVEANRAFGTESPITSNDTPGAA